MQLVNTTTEQRELASEGKLFYFNPRTGQYISADNNCINLHELDVSLGLISKFTFFKE